MQLSMIQIHFNMCCAFMIIFLLKKVNNHIYNYS